MFINPKHAIQEGWVTFPEWMSEDFKQKCIQPNALDFTVDSIYTIGDDTFKISETDKFMRHQSRMEPVNGEFTLLRGCYDAMSDFYVNVPEGVAAWLITRSTFNRNGIFIQSGLYDSGFKGNCGFVIYNLGGGATVAPHTRIGQLIFVKSEDSGIMYAGGYNTEAGQHWTTKENK